MKLITDRSQFPKDMMLSFAQWKKFRKYRKAIHTTGLPPPLTEEEEPEAVTRFVEK